MGSLGDKLNYLLDTKSAIKNALIEKGISVSASDTFRSYADKISSISSGSSGSSGSGSTAYIERVLNNGKLEMPSGSIELSSEVKNLGNWTLAYSYHSSDIDSVSFPALTALSGVYALGYAFQSCSKLTSISFPVLTTVTGVYALGYAFSQCSSLTSVSFPALTALSGVYALGYAFQRCSKLTSISFPALTSTSFGSLYTNQFLSMLSDVSNCTVHFPSNLESVIGSWSDVTSGFGGTNTIVLFDLPETT